MACFEMFSTDKSEEDKLHDDVYRQEEYERVLGHVSEE